MSDEPATTPPSVRRYDRARDFEGMFAVTRDVLSRPPYDDALRELLAYPEKSVVAYVAETPRDGVVGFCAASHPYWNAVAILDYISVAPDHRRRRVGEALVRAVERDLRGAGLRLFCVHTNSWNVDAVRFYERVGFRERARLPSYFDDEHELVWLDRRLDAARSARA